MSIINIDSFREETNVEINGQIYSLQLMTVRDYINQAIEEKLDRSSVSKFVCSAVAVFKERSNIPEAVLDRLTLGQIDMLLLALQGADLLNASADGSGK